MQKIVKTSIRTIKILLILFCAVFISGCASIYTEKWTASGDFKSPANQNIFVFFDGTANAPDSATNIWRLYQIIKNDKKLSTISMYIEGVGTRDNPLSGMALGRGMEKRILKGYEFIASAYKPGDNIYIFGFSRGAHQARSLAGFIAYSGLPMLNNDSGINIMKIGNKITEITKTKMIKII